MARVTETGRGGQDKEGCENQVKMALTGFMWPRVLLTAVNKKAQPWTGPEGSRSLSIPDFKTIGT
jgi:hypothetical protein